MTGWAFLVKIPDQVCLPMDIPGSKDPFHTGVGTNSIRDATEFGDHRKNNSCADRAAQERTWWRGLLFRFVAALDGLPHTLKHLLDFGGQWAIRGQFQVFLIRLNASGGRYDFACLIHG